MSDPIAAFGALVESHLRAILETARAAPPGGGHDWDSVLAHYGLMADTPAQRLREMEERGLTGGAVPSEVSRALTAMTARASTELARIAGAGDPGASPTEAMAIWLAEVGPRESAKYAAGSAAAASFVAPSGEPNAASASKKVASVFANAARSSKEVPWARDKSETRVTSVTLACPACGAPQERALDFQCRYCHASMGA